MLKKTVKKGLKLGLGLASFAKKEVEKNMGSFTKAGDISSKAAKKILAKVIEEAKKDGRKLEKLLILELKKEARKAKPLVKKMAGKAKSRVKKAVKKRK
ncbi:MAG: hypothetical protein KAU20_02675 [Nanoarchaeota archaeon]|nr:hypothetical protein [Nanoarchaeota archaeon]